MPASPRFQGGFLSVLQNRNFLFLWIAQSTSQIAQNMLNFMVILLVEELTGSSIQTSIAILSFLIPGVLFASIAGVIVEHVNKRTVLIVTTLLRALVAGGYFVYLLWDKWPVGYLVLVIHTLTFTRNCVNQFFWPAESAAIPLLVDRDDLFRVNALVSIGLNVYNFVGFIVLGPSLRKVMGTFAFLWLIIGMYLVAAIALWMVPRRACGVPASNGLRMRWDRGLWDQAVDAWQAMLVELRESWALIIQDRFITVAIGYSSIVQALSLMVGNLAPGFITRVLHLTAEDTFILIVPVGLGILVGFLLVTSVAKWFGLQRLVDSSMMAVGLALIGLSVAPLLQRLPAVTPLVEPNPTHPVLLAAGLCSFFLGLANLFILVPTQTLLQDRTPEEAYGRVFANRLLIANIASVGPILLTGALGDLVGISQVLGAVGVLTLLIAVGSVLYLRLPAHPPKDRQEIGR
jgi:MFS family permease